jgi:WD40 repeat protein
VILGDPATEDHFSELPMPPGVKSMHGAVFLDATGDVAAWDGDGNLRRWSIAERKWSGPWTPPVFSPKWTLSPDGRWFAAAKGREIVCARTEPGRTPAWYRLPSNPMGLALSNDGRWLAVNDDLGTVRLWDGQRPGNASLELRGHLNTVHRMVFTADSTRLVTLCSHAEAARFWAVPSGEELITLTGGSEITGAEFACGGEVLLVRGTDGWHAWRAPSTAEIDAAAPAGEW